MTLARRGARIALAVAIFTWLGPSMCADPSPIPPGVQLMLFSKIWMFDRSVPKNSTVVIAVLFQSSVRTSVEEKDRLLEAARSEHANLTCVPVALDDPENIGTVLDHVNATAFYLTEMRGIDLHRIIEASRARRIKTITANVEYLDEGVAIGLRVRNDKPDIVVNLAAARAEGSDLSAQLLRLVTVRGQGSQPEGGTK
jgi:hypothetical protein